MTRALRIAAGLAVLGVVLATTDIGRVAQAICAADVRLVGGGLLALVAVHLIPALAWRRIAARSVGADLGRVEAIRIYYAAQALGGVTPANLGGDVYRVAAMRRSGAAMRPAALPVALQRGTSVLALSLLGVAGLAWFAGSAAPAAFVPMVGLAALIAAAIGVASMVLIAPPSWLRHRFGAAVLPSARDALAGREAVLVGIVSGVAFHGLAILATWLILVATDARLGTPSVLAAVAAARLSLAIPLSPSGIGVGEGVLAALVAAAGGPAATAVAGMLVTRLALVATSVVRATLMAADSRRPAPSRSPLDIPTEPAR